MGWLILLKYNGMAQFDCQEICFFGTDHQTARKQNRKEIF